MPKQKLLIATAVLVAGAVATLLVDRGSAPLTDAHTGKPVLGGVSLAAIDQVVLKKGDKSLTLARAADQSWHLDTAQGFPADAARLARLFDDLARARVEAIASAKKEALGTYGLAAPAVVELDAGGKPQLKLGLGDARKKGGQYVVFGDEAKAYLVDQSLDAAPDADVWEHKVLLELPKNQVKSIVFTPTATSAAPATLTRAKAEDPLKLEGLAATDKEAAAVRNAETIATGLRFSKRYDRSNEEAKGAFTRPAKAVITTFDGKTYTILAGSTGAADKGAKSFVEVTGTPQADALAKTSYFEVPAGAAAAFDKAYADFIDKPAPVTPSSSGPGTP